MAVYKRKKIWCVDLYKDGKRIRRRAGFTKKQAEALELKIKTDQLNTVMNPKTDIER